ncbi:hypothetical protein MMC07_007176 [Pseudocyphellaria aurata]|nr:hypothetical protein [Pseudocyphellaria aurata]
MPRPSNYPGVAWSADNKRLTFELLDLLENNQSIRQVIWPVRGENTQGQNKAVQRREITKKLFKADPRIKDFLKDPRALSHYGMAIKNHLARLEVGWNYARKVLGVAGASLPNEGAIWNGPGEIRERWNEARQSCPWFFKMRDMAGDRWEHKAAVTNGQTYVPLDVVPLPRGDRSEQDRNFDMEDASGDDDDDEDDDAEAEIVDQRRDSLCVTNLTLTPATARAASTTSQPASSPLIVGSNSSSESSELPDEPIHVGPAQNKRKRLHDVGIEETKRLKIRERYSVENRRLAVEEKRLRLEERRLGLEEKRLEMEERLEMRRLALEEQKLAIF